MKRLVYIIPLVAFAFLAVAPAFAVGIEATPPIKEIGDWLDVVLTIARWIYTVILSVSVLMVLYAAFLYLTAGGDPGGVKKASQALIYAIVGIVVSILAFSISMIVKGVVGNP